jgi:hypothetical protein
MRANRTTVLQIVPHRPGSFDGVGDYALHLAGALLRNHGLETVFAVAADSSDTNVEGFTVMSGLRFDSYLASQQRWDRVILHYVNYGYQSRGVPFQLQKFARRLRGDVRGRWVTTLHELYASGPPWKSAFWLRPFQVRIARNIIDLSDSCFVSNTVIKSAIENYAPNKTVHLVPIMSNFGEPELIDFENRSPRTWAICGGSALIARSLRSFAGVWRKIPKTYFPERLAVIGGHPGKDIHDLLEHIRRTISGIVVDYHPEVAAESASAILAQCSFGWIDYFGDQKPWPGMILKSSSFGAFCAHGVIPVSAYEETAPLIGGDKFPGLYFVTPQEACFPEVEQMPVIRRRIYDWYHKHASSTHAAAAYAEALA